MSEIAREFGVSQTTVHAIKKGKTWKGVKATTHES
jgi:predicted transcriptional regulator